MTPQDPGDPWILMFQYRMGIGIPSFGAAPRPRRVGEANAPVPRGELCVALAPTPS
jgi:hypothetical protein